MALGKLAVKILTDTDLTLFEWHYHNQAEWRAPGTKESKQKAINLNADVFVAAFYPALAAFGIGPFNISLALAGPLGRHEVPLARKIVKSPGAKNWRLNGEIVHDPDDDRDRFHALRAGDIALINFLGEPVPIHLDIVLLSQTGAQDQVIHAAIANLIDSSRSMQSLTSAALEEAIEKIGVPENHPVLQLLIGAVVDGQPFAGERPPRPIAGRIFKGELSPEALARARAKAAEVGEQGEALVDDHLRVQADRGTISDYEWVSRQHAAQPFDFRIDDVNGGTTFADVKSTTGVFKRAIHISSNELAVMRDSPSYEIYRVYELNDGSAKLRIASGLTDWAAGVLAAVGNLPKGAAVDSISVLPEVLPFSDTYIDIGSANA